MKIDFYLLILNIVFILKLCNGLYEDQVGKFDWRQQYIGKVKQFKLEKSDASVKRFLVSTEHHILALLDIRNSRIVWRHLFETDERGIVDDFLVYSNKYVIASMGNGSFIRCYRISTGLLVWERTSKTGSTVSKLSMNANNDQLISLTSDKVMLLNTNNGVILSEYKLPTREDNKAILIHSVEGQKFSVLSVTSSIYELAEFSSDKLNQNDPPKITTLSGTRGSHRCSNLRGKQIICVYEDRLLVIFNGKSSQLVLKENFDLLYDVRVREVSAAGSGRTLILVSCGLGQHRRSILFSVTAGAISLHKKFDKVAAVSTISVNDQEIVVSLERINHQKVKLTSYNLNNMDTVVATFSGLYQFPEDRGSPLELYVIKMKNKKVTSYRFIVLSEDNSISSLNDHGTVVWTREEAIADTLNVQMVDLPLSELQAELNDFALDTDGVFTLLTKRISAQLTQIKTFILHMKHRLLAHTHQQISSHSDDMGEHIDDSANPDLPTLDPEDEYLTRDEFSLHKIIVLVTANGKLVGLDSAGGKPVWRHLIADFIPFSSQNTARIPLFIQRTTSHPNQSPQACIVGLRKFTGETIIYTFNPISGEPIGPKEGTVVLKAPVNILQVTLFSEMNEVFLKPIIFLDSNLKYHVFPATDTKLVKKSASNLYMFTASTSNMQGYSMSGTHSDLKAKLLWNIDVTDQTITTVRMKHHLEKVHSQGIVLGDRSVLYKYLNPNLIAVVTEGQEENTASGGTQGFVNIYLVDGVTGHFVFKCSHKKATGPVSIEHSEHWIIYSFWNEKNRRTEISVLELYQGSDKSNATSFSSINPENIVIPPLVLKQSYIFPGQLTTMATTLTEKGLTNKHLLIAMATGGILELPKALLDPRRPLVPTADHKEEGIIPYQPELPTPFEALINYNQSVFNIRGVHTSPAGLESTSLVFAYGLDIYFTKVMPSKMFDVLKEDFDYIFIGAVLLAMIAVSIISQQLAARKALNRAWK